MILIKNSDRVEYFALQRSQLANDEIYFLKWFMRYYIKANKKYQIFKNN